MNYRTHPAADREAEDAAEWYGQQVPYLAVEFARQYAHGIAAIATYPRMYAPADDGPPGLECRNLLRLGRFPYRIVYAIIDEDIFILAVAHHSRKPSYWHDRLPDPPSP